MPNIWSTLSDDVLLTDFTQTPQLNAEALAVDPILLMRSEGEVTHLPNGTYQPSLPNTNTCESEDENSVATSIKKREFHPSDSNSEPATKRIKTAKSLTIAVEYLDSNDKENGDTTLAQSSRRDLLLNVAKNEHSLDASDDEAEDNIDHLNYALLLSQQSLWNSPKSGTACAIIHQLPCCDDRGCTELID